MENSTDLQLVQSTLAKQDLTKEQTHQLFSSIVQGKMDNILLTALLSALKINGVTPEEMAGAVVALSDNATPFPDRSYLAVDNCGTGGDGTHTINISTICGILAATCGVKMAKHGNRSVSSKSGSADVLSSLGIKLDMTPQQAKRCLDETNLTFLMAPVYHAGIRHAMKVRQTLKTPTLFNILGPLVNPARTEIQLVGVFDPALCRPIAESLKLVGKKAVWVVHGSGMDEIALHGSTKVVQLKEGEITEFEITPEQFELTRYEIADLKGGTPEQNAENIRTVLAGKGIDAHNTAVILNTAPVLYLYGLVDSIEQGVEKAREVLLSGDAINTLDNFVRLSQQD
jgi:anthranilate phosphoribosyltransferase